MSIEILTGDMFASGADSLVCPVNCVGVMGAGVALAFRRRYQDASLTYRLHCKGCRLDTGDVLPILSGSRERLPQPGPLLYFAATKYHWQNQSQLEWIHTCADNLLTRGRANASTHHSMAVPALGVGCGGLDWDDVRPILIYMAEQLERAGVKVFLYGPQSTKRRKTS